jgi:PAS domain-containing protein
MSELEDLGGEIEDAIERVRVPAYVIDRHGIIRWLNPAARKLVGDVRGRQLTSVVGPRNAPGAGDLRPKSRRTTVGLGQQGRRPGRERRAPVRRGERRSAAER